MNLLRKSFSSSISLKPSPAISYLSSLCHNSRPYSAQAAELEKRNYANNVSEYNTVIGSLIAQRRSYLLRDVYEDMMLDGVQPVRDTYHSLIVGTMKGNRLDDAFYFRDQMKSMGLQPDVNLYNFLISACGKFKNSDAAWKLFEEMKFSGVKPKRETYISLLNALAANACIDQVYEVVRDMTADGLGLNRFCYAGLITAYKNKTPVTSETFTKIVEYVDQALKGWSSVEQGSDGGENFMMNISEEELYNMPTSEFINRRGFVIKKNTIFHVALNACADLRSKETMEIVLDKMKEAQFPFDAFITMQVIRCYLYSGDIDSAVRVFEEFTSNRPPSVELYATLIEGAMFEYTEKGMQLAQSTLETMTAKGYFLNPRIGSDLLLIAAGEKTGGYMTANYIWDILQSRRIIPTLPAVDAYYKGLKEREIPADDPRIMVVKHTFEDLQARLGPRRNIPNASK